MGFAEEWGKRGCYDGKDIKQRGLGGGEFGQFPYFWMRGRGLVSTFGFESRDQRRRRRREYAGSSRCGSVLLVLIASGWGLLTYIFGSV